MGEQLFKYRVPFLFIILGALASGIGLLFFNFSHAIPNGTSIEILGTPSPISDSIVVEVSGAVKSPGVYSFSSNDRINDAIVKAGGYSGNEDGEWVDKTVNLAAKLTDGQKIYVPESKNGKQLGSMTAKENAIYQTTSANSDQNAQNQVNINIASQSELESLTGIGPVYAQKIIDGRSYSNTRDLVTKGVIGESLYAKIQNQISVY